MTKYSTQSTSELYHRPSYIMAGRLQTSRGDTVERLHLDMTAVHGMLWMPDVSCCTPSHGEAAGCC
jgi:hypothetical protein